MTHQSNMIESTFKKIESRLQGVHVAFPVMRRADSQSRVSVNSTLYQVPCQPFSLVHLKLNLKDEFQVFLSGNSSPLSPCEANKSISASKDRLHKKDRTDHEENI